jgi:hypothetical protein
MSKNSPKQRLIAFRNWLTTVKPVKLDRNKGKKKRNEKNPTKYRPTSRS